MIRIAKTESGLVQGIEAADPRITAFKGIPFAKPPIKENRWKAPEPCDHWEGIKECFRFAPIGMQDTPGIGDDIYCREWHVDPEIAMSEDCLYLNIWTGAKNTEEKLPVFIWFFGGALQWGYPSEMEFDGERLARRGIIVVTINYRLNVFGFLAHPELTKSQPTAPTNFGSLDQQAAIQWVKRNIRAFGGDEENITIGGQSAGGGSVMSQLVCPSNKGSFQKAIVASGMIRNPYGECLIEPPISLERAEDLGKRFFDYLGVKGLEEARQLDAVYILHKYTEFAQTNPRMYSCVDGRFCVGDPIHLFLQGKHAGVPILAGNTTDEFPNSIIAESKEDYVKKVQEIFGEQADTFLSFPEAMEQDKDNQYASVSGIECTVKSIILSYEKQKNQKDCYYYCFDVDIPGWDHPGTFHSVDLWFFFETLAKCWRPFTGRHYDVSRLMCNYWANFIKNGNPNGDDADGSPMPQWTPYTTKTPCSMIFNKNGVKQKEMEKESEFLQFLIEKITRENE